MLLQAGAVINDATIARHTERSEDFRVFSCRTRRSFWPRAQRQNFSSTRLRAVVSIIEEERRKGRLLNWICSDGNPASRCRRELGHNWQYIWPHKKKGDSCNCPSQSQLPEPPAPMNCFQHDADGPLLDAVGVEAHQADGSVGPID